MAKICITERTPEKNCQTCAHRKYDQDEQEYYCSAKPNWIGEVEWANKGWANNMSSIPMYAFMSEEKFNKAMENGETIRSLAPDRDYIAKENDFPYYFGYVSNVDYHELRDESAEAAKEVAHYLGDFVHVDANGVLEIPVDGKVKFATKKLERIKKLVADMTPEVFGGMGEYRLRQAVRDEGIFAHPLGDDLPVGCYLQPMDAFMYNLPSKLEKPLRLIVIQTAWLHQ